MDVVVFVSNRLVFQKVVDSSGHSSSFGEVDHIFDLIWIGFIKESKISQMNPTINSRIKEVQSLVSK